MKRYDNTSVTIYSNKFTLKNNIIITRPRPILSHNCPAREGQLCDKSPWKRSTCNSWFCVTSLVAFLKADGRLSMGAYQRNILFEMKGRCCLKRKQMVLVKPHFTQAGRVFEL